MINLSIVISKFTFSTTLNESMDKRWFKGIFMKKYIYQASGYSNKQVICQALHLLFLITAKRVTVKKHSHARANSVDPDMTAHRCAVKTGLRGPVRIKKMGKSTIKKQTGNWLRCYEYTPRGSNLVIFIFASPPNGSQHVNNKGKQTKAYSCFPLEIL